MATTSTDAAATTTGSLDFSEPWNFSDVVLKVEEQRFHCHRSTLAFWSPVFEKMFTSNFKEKNSDEIQLPGKKASEIKEMLLLMYPSLKEKALTKDNCYFLLELAREYQMDKFTQKCEEYLISMVQTRKGDVLALLIVGQNYQLKKLIETCMYEARHLSLEELKRHPKREDIDRDTFMEIAEAMIGQVKEQWEKVKEQCEKVKASSLEKVRDLSLALYRHAAEKSNKNLSPMYGRHRSVSDCLTELNKDYNEHRCDKSSPSTCCPPLYIVAEHLTKLKNTIETLKLP
ncbi:BTB and MATH domain-containing protein 36-like [Oculina patagonica]